MFFGEIYQGAMFLTGGTASSVGLLRSDDGASFAETAGFAGWLWLPVAYQGRLYVLGHAGAAYEDAGAAAVVSDDGVNFQPVDALAGGAEYQTAFVWQGALYLGTGGWTTARTADDRAQIYRFDGSTRTLVLSEGMNGVTSFAAMGGKLFAALDSGWERDAGQSRLYESTDGASWTQVETFADPELRHLETLDDETLVLFGGQACQYGVIYTYRDTPAEPLAVLTTELPAGFVGSAYSATLEAAHGWPPYGWSLTSGVLPDGLGLDGATGALAGTPTAVGSSALHFGVSDALQATAESDELVLSISEGAGAGGSHAGGAGTGASGNSGGDADAAAGDEGCGCRAGPVPRRATSGVGWLAWLALAALARRRPLPRPVRP
jgi:MYXO-CTERM domain-containing protein